MHTIDTSGLSGGGEVYIGGGIHGYLDGVISHSNITDVSAGTYIHADALDNGDGGTVVVWGTTRAGFYGNITARGGATGGNGGFVDVSAGDGVVFEGMIDTTANLGRVGDVLMYPVGVLICSGLSGGYC